MQKTRLFAWLLAVAFSGCATLAHAADPAYPQQREQLRARIAELSQSASESEVLAAMHRLGTIADLDVTEAGELAVRGKRPTDLRELLTWQRMDWIRL